MGLRLSDEFMNDPISSMVHKKIINYPLGRLRGIKIAPGWLKMTN